MADTCRCGLPVAPEGPHWWPEPGPQVQAVALLGRDPGFLRSVRVPGGWHTRGTVAAYADCTPPRPWVRVGRCWAGVDHPVVDVSAAHTRSAEGR